MLSRLLFKLARTRGAGALVGLGFAHFAFLLPVRRVADTGRVLAFHHPRPSWERHILLVPKRRIRSLLHVTDAGLYEEILAAASQALSAVGLKAEEAVLCANGGPRQEVGQLHFHLFTGERYVASLGTEMGAPVYSKNEVTAFHHPAPDWETHLVLQSNEIAQMAQAVASLVTQFDLASRGYTLVIQLDDDKPTFHLIAGRRLAI